MRSLRRRLLRLERHRPEASCDYCLPIFDAPIRYIKAGEPEPEPLPDECPKCGRERPDAVHFICLRRSGESNSSPPGPASSRSSSE
jgi:hypothetical protein